MKLTDVINKLAEIQANKNKSTYNVMTEVAELFYHIDEVVSVLSEVEDQIDTLTRDLNEATERIAEYESELGMVMVS